MVDTVTDLLGFDVRLAPEVFAKQFWTPSRRALLLLRHDVENPLSVDFRVWPSTYWQRGWLGFRPELEAVVRSYFVHVPTEVENPRMLGLHLWSHFDAMMNHYKKHKRVTKVGIPVAIVLQRTTSEKLSDPGQWQAVFDPPVHPPKLSNAWQLAGYDVANQFLESAVSGFGYSDEDDELRREWRGSVNQTGLIERAEDAVRFRNISSARLPGPAPFYVLRLYIQKEYI